MDMKHKERRESYTAGTTVEIDVVVVVTGTTIVDGASVVVFVVCAVRI